MLKKDVRDFLDAWEQAYINADRDALGKLYEEDILFSPHGLSVIDGREAVVGFLCGIADAHEFDLRQEVDDVTKLKGTEGLNFDQILFFA